MKHLYIEYTPDFFYQSKDKLPSPSFKRFLSKNLGTKLCKLVGNENEEQVFNTVCLCFDHLKTYLNPIEDENGNRYIKVSIRHISAPLRLCDLFIKFDENARNFLPWDKTIQTTACKVSFVISRSELYMLRSVISELYRITVRSEESGLSFDYEMHATNEGILRIKGIPGITKDELKEICSAVENFIETYNDKNIDAPINFYEKLKSAKESIRYRIDLGGASGEVIEQCIRSLNDLKIKNIVFS